MEHLERLIVEDRKVRPLLNEHDRAAVGRMHQVWAFDEGREAPPTLDENELFELTPEQLDKRMAEVWGDDVVFQAKLVGNAASVRFTHGHGAVRVAYGLVAAVAACLALIVVAFSQDTDGGSGWAGKLAGLFATSPDATTPGGTAEAPTRLGFGDTIPPDAQVPDLPQMAAWNPVTDVPLSTAVLPAGLPFMGSGISSGRGSGWGTNDVAMMTYAPMADRPVVMGWVSSRDVARDPVDLSNYNQDGLHARGGDVYMLAAHPDGSGDFQAGPPVIWPLDDAEMRVRAAMLAMGVKGMVALMQDASLAPALAATGTGAASAMAMAHMSPDPLAPPADDPAVAAGPTSYAVFQSPVPSARPERRRPDVSAPGSGEAMQLNAGPVDLLGREIDLRLLTDVTVAAMESTPHLAGQKSWVVDMQFDHRPVRVFVLTLPAVNTTVSSVAASVGIEPGYVTALTAALKTLRGFDDRDMHPHDVVVGFSFMDQGLTPQIVVDYKKGPGHDARPSGDGDATLLSLSSCTTVQPRQAKRGGGFKAFIATVTGKPGGRACATDIDVALAQSIANSRMQVPPQ